MVFQVAGSNATEVNAEISKLLSEINEELPEGLEFMTMMSSNDFLFASIHEVVETLIVAIILVILVVYFFLQDFKSTLIPSISIIVSLVGTFAAMQIAGFSINILTLFALVLVIGTVVDDSIVVVEAVQSKFDVGYTSPYLATKEHCLMLPARYHLYPCVHGCVYPCDLHGRYVRYLLHSIRCDHGRSRRYFMSECLDVVSGAMCYVDASCERQERQKKH